jgi:hypothetical protein
MQTDGLEIVVLVQQTLVQYKTAVPFISESTAKSSVIK